MQEVDGGPHLPDDLVTVSNETASVKFAVALPRKGTRSWQAPSGPGLILPRHCGPLGFRSVQPTFGRDLLGAFAPIHSRDLYN